MNNELIKRIISSIILLPFTFFFIIEGSILFNLLILLCFLITSFEWHMMSKKKPYYLIGYLFLFFSFYSIYILRNEYPGGYLHVLLIISICVFTDIGGYIFGKVFKGPKLTKFSPNKTYSGMLGSYTSAILFTTILFNNDIIFSNIAEINLNFFIFVFIVSTVSQLGDISISYFKRLSKIKDTGTIIPGHGGLLDRVDGMIFAFPFSFIILSITGFRYF